MHAAYSMGEPIRKRSSWYRQSVRLVGFGVSGLIVLYLLLEIDLDHVVGMLGSVPLSSLVGAFGIYMLLNFLRALRFRFLLGQPQVTIRRLYPIALYHNFLVRTLPFKTGELSYLVLTRQYLKQPVDRGVGSLVSARLYDLCVVVAISLVALLAVSPSGQQVQAAIPALALVVSLSLVVLYYAGNLLRILNRCNRWLMKRGWAAQWKFGQHVEQKLLSLAEQLDANRTPRFFWAAILLSLSTYLASAAFNALLLEALGIRLQIGVMILVISGVMLAEALPLSIAGLGLVEGGWTMGLTAFAGLDMSQAVATAFFLHACQLLAVCLSGLIGYCLLHTARASAIGQE